LNDLINIVLISNSNVIEYEDYHGSLGATWLQTAFYV